MRRPTVPALIAAAGGAAIALDAFVLHLVTGILAAWAMLLTLGVLAVRAWRLRAATHAAMRRVQRFEGVVVAGAAAFLVARFQALIGQMSAGAAHAAAARLYDTVFLVLVGLGLAILQYAPRMARLSTTMARRPSVVLASGFLALIVVGGLLLSLPVSLVDTGHISFLDGLFIMTSAVCVTGLATVDLGTTYSAFGQGVILVGVQLGGVGVTTVAAFALTLQRETALEEHAHYARVMEARTLSDLRRIVRGVIITTLIIEAVGAGLLWLLWNGDPAFAGRSVIWAAIFHAVSAFCNAGFSLFPDNLTRFHGDAAALSVIGALVIFGGIGFPVITEVFRRGFLRLLGLVRRRHRVVTTVSVTTRIVVVASVLLTIGGALLFALFEWNQSMHAMGGFDAVVNALFQSIIARTAGFNTIDFAQARAATLLVFILLMFIGGSPASAAGGIKTTTLAVLGATLIAELRGREARLFGRAIAPETLRRAVAVATLSVAMVVVLTLALTLTERQAFLPLAFEAVSAFATVGFSAGITPSLTAAGKLIVMVGMFVGRVGPLTVVTLVGAGEPATRHRLPPEQIPVG